MAKNLSMILDYIRGNVAKVSPYTYPIQPPILHDRVVPKGITAPILAQDSDIYTYASNQFPGGGFPGYPHLAGLSTRPEYRLMVSALSFELTREWVEITSPNDEQKIKEIGEEFKRLHVREAFRKIAEHDAYFGRGQMFISLKNHDISEPLIIDKRTIKPKSLEAIRIIEPIWTTPSAYNTNDPLGPNYYIPQSWYVMGQTVHSSRLCSVITREMPDILKPSFNFGGISLSQLVEPYVDNWLRTRQSVADLVNNFSLTALQTDMGAVLQDEDLTEGKNLIDRANLFTLLKSNKGLMLLDKEKEELIQLNTPLSGLGELQAQSLEHLCSASRIPAIILTGISPAGLNATSEGEVRVFYDWISSQQETFYLQHLRKILQLVQLNLYGEIDTDIECSYKPLYQMTDKELAEIRSMDAVTDTAYHTMGVISAEEIRNRLSKNPTNGYEGLEDYDEEDFPPDLPEPRDPE